MRLRVKTVRLKTSLLAILAVMGSVPGAGAQGQPKPQSVPSSAACYEAIVAPEVSEIRRIVVDAGKPDIRVEFQGASKVPFFSGGRCAGGAGGITCQAECDGGSVRMTVAGNELNLTTKRYALDAEIESALPFPMEADSGNLSGSFSLKRVDARVCAAAFNSRTSMGGELQRGDFSPRVRRIRKYLSDLGFLLQRPDWSFDAATENAMRAFQRSAGLTISGTADRDTVARLRLAAQLRGGC
jgi:hypothetical protein